MSTDARMAYDAGLSAGANLMPSGARVRLSATLVLLMLAQSLSGLTLPGRRQGGSSRRIADGSKGRSEL